MIVGVAITAQDRVEFSGTLSSVLQTNEEQKQSNIYLKYLPRLDVRMSSDFDVEFSYIAYSYSGKADLKQIIQQHEGKLYRFWLRYQAANFEARLGLQKINFGPARILRSLMWFDRIDPKDPTQFTEGVKALRIQYYFPNNANLWLWGLYGNKDPRGWDFEGSDKHEPEFGGRFQFPIKNGEFAVTAHHRTLENDQKIQNRMAVDGFMDVGIGLWFESAIQSTDFDNYYISFSTIGSDYTIPWGNGVSLTLEHLFSLMKDYGFNPDKQSGHVSSMMVQYPLGMFDSVSYYNYFIWEKDVSNHFIAWSRTYDQWTIQCAGYKTIGSPVFLYSNEQSNSLGKHGLQLTIVFNH